jgi:hypothetical protein
MKGPNTVIDESKQVELTRLLSNDESGNSISGSSNSGKANNW